MATPRGLHVVNYRYDPFVDIYVSKRADLLPALKGVGSR